MYQAGDFPLQGRCGGLDSHRFHQILMGVYSVTTKQKPARGTEWDAGSNPATSTILKGFECTTVNHVSASSVARKTQHRFLLKLLQLMG